LSNIREKLGKINLEKCSYYKAYTYVVSKLTISFVAFFIITLMGYVKCINDTFSYNRNIKSITRSEYRGGDRKYRLNVIFDNGSSESLNVILPERKYTEKEIFEIFEENYEKIIKEVLDENISTDNVTNNLNFISNYGDIINIQWNVEDNNYIDYSGCIKWDDIYKNNLLRNIEINIEMILSIGDVSKLYEVPININAGSRLKKDIVLDEINDYINEYSEYDKDVILPDSLDNESVMYVDKREKATLVYAFFAIIIGIIIYIIKNRELQNTIKKRNEQLESDYVFIISKIAILHSAGMTILSAWDKIIDDYNAGLNDEGKRYAYEEMKIARQKIKNGASELSSYVEFGRRCGLHSYIKLGNLLEQNVRKGTKGLKEMLEQEVNEAYENRKVRARKKGDEAGTKLLIPMIIMLVISMIMIIVPEFMSVNI
jgi:preprotein translocase subunit YajC